MRRHLIITFLSCSLIHADDSSRKTDVTTEEEPKSRLAALELLPAGSILKKISVPRYSKDYIPSSLLTADQFEVISETEIQGTNVGLCLYDTAGKLKTCTKLNSVNFDQTTGLITSKENLTFSGDTFTASSQGVTLDWEKHRGFLLGKNQTIIYLKKATLMNNSTSHPTPAQKSTPSKKIGVVAVATSALISATSPLTADELAQIDQLSQPTTSQFIQQLDDTKAALTATAEAEAKIAAIQKELNEQLGGIPKIDPAQAAPPELVPVKGKDFIDVKSDRLMFDAKKGVFVYFGNVSITHPKMTFTCDGELKIILSEAAAAKKLAPEAKAKLKPNDLFDDVSHIIATKKVIVRGKDNKGRPVNAVTDNLSYNKATGKILLKGKGSRITTADGQLKVVTQNGYILLDQNMNASGQGTNTEFIVPKNQ